MDINTPEISEYCIEHSTRPSADCDAIEKYTVEKVPMSVMLSGQLVGSLLGFLVGTTRAKRVLEIGTYTGYSALCMAERLPADGELITLDINPETAKIAQSFWDKSPHGKKIKSIVGPAGESLKGLKAGFDLVFIDADKPGYTNYLEAALPLLAPTGAIVCDNCLQQGEVLDPTTPEPSPRAIRVFNQKVSARADLECVLLPVRDGLMLIRKSATAKK